VNERIKELAQMSGLAATSNGTLYLLPIEVIHIEHFAELVRQDEREACAKLCENGAFLHDQAPDALFGRSVAKAIRAKGNT